MSDGTSNERDWHVVGDDVVVHDGWIRVTQRTYRLPDGRLAVWDMFGGGQVVGVLPLTPEGQVVCVRQFRPGPDRVVLNIPGGFVEPGETPLAAAARELTEETGYIAAELEHVVSAMSAASTGKRHVVIARGCTPTGRQCLDEYEDCETVLLDVDDVRAELRAGRMTGNELVYLGLDHAGLL